MLQLLDLAGFQRMGFVKRIQHGTITLSAATTGTATLSPAVDPSNTLIVPMGTRYGTTVPDVTQARLTINSTGTTLTATAGAAATLTVNYLVVELFPGLARSAGSGTITITEGNTTNTATFSRRVDLNRTIVVYLGQSATGSSVFPGEYWNGRLDITDNNTLTLSRQSTSGGVGDITGAYAYLELQ